MKVHLKRYKVAIQKFEIEGTVIHQEFGDGIKPSIRQTVEYRKQCFS